MRYLLLLLVVLGGACIPVQVASNKRMDQAVQSPVLASTLAFVVGGIALAALTLTGWLGRGHLSGAVDAPWWAWAGGALSLFTVVSIIALPKTGAAAVIAATIFGELLASALIDHFGWLNVPQVKLNVWRVMGAVALFGGALMMQHK